MNWLQRFLYGSPSKLPISARQLAGGRASRDKAEEPLAGFGVIIESPPTPELSWRTMNLDSKTLARISPARLLELLADLSPDVSRALWDFLRLVNPGWEVMAFQPGADEQDEAAQATIDEFVAELHDLYGSMDIIIGRLYMGAFLRGALFAELVLDEDGITPLDIATPDPHSARFRRVNDEVRGTVWELGQWQGAVFVPLDRPTIRYVPIDPFPGSPYGRPMVTPALFSTLFLLGLMHDLRRVVAQQGYPRLDLEINLERLAGSLPSLANDPDKFKSWVEAIVDEVQKVYSALEPDDAYIHTDVVKVNRPVGTVDASALGAIDGLINALERMSTRALKSMPLLMGTRQSTTETQANREWEVMAAGIKSIQHLAENLLGRFFQLALEAQGIQANVEVRFSELRASEMLRDAQTEALLIQNAAAKYALGIISLEEAAMKLVGHPPDAQFPRIVLAPPTEGALQRPDWLAEIREARKEVARAIVALNGHA